MLCFANTGLRFDDIVLCFDNTVLCFDDIVLCFHNTVFCFDNNVLCFDNTVLCFDNSFLCSDNTMLCIEKCLLCFNNFLLCLQIWATVHLRYCTVPIINHAKMKSKSVTQTLIGPRHTAGCITFVTQTRKLNSSHRREN